MYMTVLHIPVLSVLLFPDIKGKVEGPRISRRGRVTHMYAHRGRKARWRTTPRLRMRKAGQSGRP